MYSKLSASVLYFSSMDWMMALGGSLVDLGFILLDTHVKKLRIVGGRICDSNTDGNGAVAELGKWLVYQCFVVSSLP
jgi:hypothetical protein